MQSHQYISRNAARNFPSTVKKFISDVQRTMGVQLFIMAGFVKPGGDVIRGR